MGSEKQLSKTQEDRNESETEILKQYHIIFKVSQTSEKYYPLCYLKNDIDMLIDSETHLTKYILNFY